MVRKLVNYQKKATAKCVLKTDGYQAIFEFDKQKHQEVIDLVVEFKLNPQLQELSLKSVSSFTTINDLQRLAAYLENHIARLRENSDSISEIFMDYSLAFQMQAFEGNIDVDIENDFGIQTLVNLGMYDQESSRTYVGGISVITLEDAEKFISSIREFVINIC